MNKKKMMEETQPLTLAEALEGVYQNVDQRGLNDITLNLIKEETDFLAKKLGFTPVQSVLFAIILNEAYDGKASSMEIVSKLKISRIKAIALRPDFDSLINKRVIREFRLRDNLIYYRVPANVIKSIQNNKPIDRSEIKNLSLQQIFKQLYMLYRDNNRGELSMKLLVMELNDLATYNRSNAFFGKCEEYGLDKVSDLEFFLAFYMMHRYDSFGESEFWVMQLNELLDDDEDGLQSDEFEFCFTKAKSKLFSKGFIEFVCHEGIVDNTKVRLTDKAMNDLLADVRPTTSLLQMNIPAKERILCSSIAKKSMYYNPEDGLQIQNLTKLLGKTRFAGVEKRLKKMQMRSGFCCLFYGAPGTGKTETAMQIARKTGRDIYMVDVSKLKSKWVGDSEKQVRELFVRYRELVDNMEVAPILLFNEADALFGIRKSGADSSIDKMYNAVQNIILQEMENLHGIMIATTNLTSNFDAAFERRFLYKIEFHKPGLEAKSRIWKSMIESLSKKDAAELAAVYDFSGGQIENIARKISVDYVLTGRIASLEKIKEMCDHECIASSDSLLNRRKIGFAA